MLKVRRWRPLISGMTNAQMYVAALAAKLGISPAAARELTWQRMEEARRSGR